MAINTRPLTCTTELPETRGRLAAIIILRTFAWSQHAHPSTRVHQTILAFMWQSVAVLESLMRNKRKYEQIAQQQLQERLGYSC